MNVASACKRFYRLALQILQRSGRTRSFDCFYELLDEIDTRCQVVQIAYLDSISLDLSRFHSAYLEEISKACFAPRLKRLKISSNQPALINNEDIETIKKFTNLETLELNWFFHSKALLQLSSLSIIVVEPF